MDFTYQPVEQYRAIMALLLRYMIPNKTSHADSSLIAKCIGAGQPTQTVQQDPHQYFLVDALTLSQTSPGFYVSAVLVLKTLGKGEIAHNEQFLLPQCFLLVKRTFSHCYQNLKLSTKSFSLKGSKICCLGKG